MIMLALYYQTWTNWKINQVCLRTVYLTVGRLNINFTCTEIKMIYCKRECCRNLQITITRVGLEATQFIVLTLGEASWTLNAVCARLNACMNDRAETPTQIHSSTFQSLYLTGNFDHTALVHQYYYKLCNYSSHALSNNLKSYSNINQIVSDIREFHLSLPF